MTDQDETCRCARCVYIQVYEVVRGALEKAPSEAEAMAVIHSAITDALVVHRVRWLCIVKN